MISLITAHRTGLGSGSDPVSIFQTEPVWILMIKAAESWFEVLNVPTESRNCGSINTFISDQFFDDNVRR